MTTPPPLPRPDNGIKTAVVAAFFGALVSTAAWAVATLTSGQVAQARNAQAIDTVKVAAADNASTLDRYSAHHSKIDEALHAINLTSQRLADMLAHHEAALEELKADGRRRRRGR